MQQKNYTEKKNLAVSNNYPPFLLQKTGKSACPIVIASPHSGTFYPERFFHLTDLKIEDFQKYEDAAVDKLFSFAPAFGIPLLSAVYGRAWVDLNRHPLELDPRMFSDRLPPQAQTESARVKAGFGAIPRLLSPNKPIYKQRLLYRTEQKRLMNVHIPYHAALMELVKKNIMQFGKSLLIDAHSMPELPKSAQVKGQTPDFVLGNGDGTTCAPEIITAAAEILKEMGFFVTRNLPYSGAYTTLYYGRPTQHSHTLQIEIARHLYWDVDHYAPSGNFNVLWRKLSLFTERFVQVLPLLPL